MGTANDGSFRNTDALYPVVAITASQAPEAPTRTFFTGYDLRNRDAVGSPEDRPYVAWTLLGTF